MLKLSIDSNVSADVLTAIQTILNAFAKEKKDNDRLLDRIKILEYEKQTLLQNLKVESSFDHSITTEVFAKQQKRIKTDFKNDECVNQDILKDELNAAFHSTSIGADIMESSQSEPSQCDPDKSKMYYSFSYDPEKENQNESNLNVNEKSPTVLSKNYTKSEKKVMHTENERSEWRTKGSAKNITPRRIFDNYSKILEIPSQSNIQANSTTRKRHSLSLGKNTTRLKQHTFDSPRYADETYYCEQLSGRMDKSHVIEISNPVQRCSAPRHLDSVKITKDDSVAFGKNMNEVITIEESQSTQEFYKYIADVKEEMQKQILIDDLPDKIKNAVQVQSVKCADCEKYHRLLGRDLQKDFPKNFGVCYKHRRNIQYADTPPGFWNPKIVDSDSDSDH